MTATADELRKLRREILDAIEARTNIAEAARADATASQNDYATQGYRGELIGLSTAHTEVWEVFQAHIDAAGK